MLRTSSIPKSMKLSFSLQTVSVTAFTSSATQLIISSTFAPLLGKGKQLSREVCEAYGAQSGGILYNYGSPNPNPHEAKWALLHGPPQVHFFLFSPLHKGIMFRCQPSVASSYVLLFVAHSGVGYPKFNNLLSLRLCQYLKLCIPGGLRWLSGPLFTSFLWYKRMWKQSIDKSEHDNLKMWSQKQNLCVARSVPGLHPNSAVVSPSKTEAG